MHSGFWLTDCTGGYARYMFGSEHSRDDSRLHQSGASMGTWTVKGRRSEQEAGEAQGNSGGVEMVP